MPSTLSIPIELAPPRQVLEAPRPAARSDVFREALREASSKPVPKPADDARQAPRPNRADADSDRPDATDAAGHVDPDAAPPEVETIGDGGGGDASTVDESGDAPGDAAPGTDAPSSETPPAEQDPAIRADERTTPADGRPEPERGQPADVTPPLGGDGAAGEARAAPVAAAPEQPGSSVAVPAGAVSADDGDVRSSERTVPPADTTAAPGSAASVPAGPSPDAPIPSGERSAAEPARAVTPTDAGRASVAGLAAPRDDRPVARTAREPRAEGGAARGRGDALPPQGSSADRPLGPAAARALQVEQSLQLETQTGRAPSASAVGPALAAPSDGAGHGGAGTAALLSASPEDAQGSTDAQRFTARIVRSLSALVNQRGGVMTMRLDPPELGQLRIQMNLARGVVAADFQASTASARTLLEKHLTVLRAALETQGLSVERLSVHVASGHGAAFTGADAQDQQGADGGERDAGDGESRGRGREPGHDGRRGKHASFDELFAGSRIEHEPPSKETT